MHCTLPLNSATLFVGLTARRGRHELVDGVSVVRIFLEAGRVTMAVAQEQAHNLEISALSTEQP